VAIKTKECSICREAKLLSDFQKHAGCALGVRPECKICLRNIRADYRESYKQRHNKNNRGYYRRRAEDYSLNPGLYLLDIARKRAKKFSLEFNISDSDIHVPERCPITGVKLAIFVTDRSESYRNAASLDRVDNSKGYIVGNVRVISRMANMMKRDLTIETAEKLIQYMKGEI